MYRSKGKMQFREMAGRDGFSRQLKAIRNLSALPIEFTCSIVLTYKNINSLCNTVRNARDNGADKFSFTFVIDNEKSLDSDEAYLTNHNPLALVDTFISQIDKLNAITEEWWIEYSFPMCVYTERQLKILEGRLASSCQIHIENGITFDTEMNLIPCNIHFENRMGKLGEDFLSYTEFSGFFIDRCIVEQLIN